MSQPHVGTYVPIHSYKHDGSIHRTWEKGLVLETGEDYLIVVNSQTLVTESDGRVWYTREPAVCCFYKKYWFNVICMIRKNGIYYYCNLASPYVWDNEAIKYIDYDLDLKVFPDQTWRVLDEEEYRQHKLRMDYPYEIDLIIRNQMDVLKSLVKQRNEPFVSNYVEKLYEQYLHMQANR